MAVGNFWDANFASDSRHQDDMTFYSLLVGHPDLNLHLPLASLQEGEGLTIL